MKHPPSPPRHPRIDKSLVGGQQAQLYERPNHCQSAAKPSIGVELSVTIAHAPGDLPLADDGHMSLALTCAHIQVEQTIFFQSLVGG